MDDKLKENKKEYDRIMEENKEIIKKFNEADIKKLDELRFINTVLASLYKNETTIKIFEYVFDYAIRHQIKINNQEKYQDWIIDIKCEEFENKG